MQSGGYSKDTAYLQGLVRHFVDLRDGTHGDTAVSRQDKEALFAQTIPLLHPYAMQALNEMNEVLLLGTGMIEASGMLRSADGDAAAAWTLSWAEQQERRVQPVTIEAIFGHGFHHPHLRGATVGYWPLNAFSDADAALELQTLRAIAVADLHNLVFQSDYRIIPAVAANSGA